VASGERIRLVFRLRSGDEQKLACGKEDLAQCLIWWGTGMEITNTTWCWGYLLAYVFTDNRFQNRTTEALWGHGQASEIPPAAFSRFDNPKCMERGFDGVFVLRKSQHSGSFISPLSPPLYSLFIVAGVWFTLLFSPSLVSAFFFWGSRLDGLVGREGWLLLGFGFGSGHLALCVYSGRLIR